MENILLYFLIYFLIIFSVILVSKKLDLYDYSNNRKIHKIKILNTGGLAIGIYCIFLVSNNELNLDLENVLISGIFILILGFIDDLKDLSPSVKLFGIMISSFFLIQNDFILNSLGNFELLGNFQLGKLSFLFTLFSACLLINAINYIDGVDGLLLSNTLTTFVYYLFLINDFQFSLLIFYLSIPVFINLIFNFFPINSGIKIFNGNAGSLYLGFIISFFSISIHKQYNIHPVYLIWTLWYPVYDFLCVSINRLLNKRSPLKADKTHFHHYLYYKFNNNHFKTTFVISLINIFVLFVGYQISNFSKLLSLLLFIVLFFVYFVSKKLLKNYA